MFGGVCCGESEFGKGFGFGLAMVAWQCLMVFVVLRVGLAMGF